MQKLYFASKIAVAKDLNPKNKNDISSVKFIPKFH